MIVDVDADGLEDVVTARATKPLLGSAKGELIWLQNPGNNTSTNGGYWKEFILTDGPDIDFDLVEVSPGQIIVFAAQFFGKQLSVHYIQNGTVVKSQVVDNSEGEMYTAKIAEIFGNRTFYLISNNYKYSGSGSIFAYKIGGSGIWNLTFEKHLFATGFKNLQWAPGYSLF